MAKYRKKPVEVEAFQYDGDLMDRDGCFYVPEWAIKAFVDGVIEFKDAGEMYVSTMHAKVGDYIIKGVQGELYLCEPDIFEQTYGAVDELVAK